jgi:UDP-glucose 4-epimerase
MSKFKNVLVTGGAGFIGSNLIKFLVKKNWKVRAIDNLSSGDINNINNIDVDFIEGDIRNFDLIEKSLIDIDIVFHLAASVGRQRSIDNPFLDSETNILGTLNVLEGMKRKAVPKIIYSSSAAIFGELQTNPINEHHELNPDSPYGVSKLAAEKMVIAFSRLNNFSSTCLRYFNIYGKNQKYDFYGNVIPIFANRICNNKPIEIFGDGEQTRDFLNVYDVVKVNYLAAINSHETNVYNIGSGQSISINKLVKLMKKISNNEITINYLPSRKAEVRDCKADISKVKRDFGFSPSIDLEFGLHEYLQWFKLNNSKII